LNAIVPPLAVADDLLGFMLFPGTGRWEVAVWRDHALVGTVVFVLPGAAHAPGGPATAAARHPPAGWRLFVSAAGDLSLFYPADWHLAGTDLTPEVGDPAHVVALGTFSMAPADHNCTNVPVNALEALTPADAFVAIREQLSGYGGPPRPPRFDATSGTDLTEGDARVCLGHPLAGNGRWIDFDDGGRDFLALVAVGAEATPARRAQAFDILNSFEVRPLGP
jgi:hypothetical protein